MPLLDKDRIIEVGLGVVGDRLRRPRKARLGNPLSGEVIVSLEDADQPGMVYLHGVSGAVGALSADPEEDDEDKQMTTQAVLPPGLLGDDYLVYGNYVEVVRREGRLRVVGGDPAAGNEYMHNVKLPPQRSIVISQVDYGLLRPTTPPTLKILLSGARYILNGTVYDAPTRQSGSLASYRPATAGRAVGVKVEIDPVTATLYYTAGTEFDSSISHADAFSFYSQTVDDARFLCGWVKVANGQTSITIRDIYHGHELLNKDTGLTMAEIAARILVDDTTGDVLTADGEIVWI